MPARRHVEEIGSAAMLVPKRLAGVAPEVNLREHLTHMPMPSANKAPHPGFEIREISPEDQNRGISGLTKGTYVLQNIFKKYTHRRVSGLEMVANKVLQKPPMGGT